MRRERDARDDGGGFGGGGDDVEELLGIDSVDSRLEKDDHREYDCKER